MTTPVATPVIFSMGLPYGRWERLAHAILGVPSGDVTPMAQLHDKLLQVPASQGMSPGDAERLLHIRAASVQWPSWTPMASGAACVGGIDARLCWTAGAVAEACAAAHFIIWVEHPGHALAHWLAIRPADSAPEPMLQVVHSAAQSMLDFAQSHPSRCLVIDVDDALAQPVELAKRLAGWSVMPHAANASGLPAADALARVLGARWAASDHKLIQIHEHLSASCVVLAKSTPAESQETDPDEIVATALGLYAERRNHSAHAATSEASVGDREAMSEVQKWEQEVKEAIHDRDALLVQLHQLQEKVARGLRAGAPAISALSAAHAPKCGDGHIEAGAVTDSPPLRGQTLKLGDIRIGSRTYPWLTVRLVEHHGHPGIAIFENEGTREKPLRAWETTGEKSKRAFMLLVPEDELSRQRLLQLSTDDWQFVHGLVATVVSRLRKRPTVVAPRWLTVAHRLLARLDHLPPRLRFNRIEVADEPTSKAIKATFHDVALISIESPELTLLWNVPGEGGRQCVIELLFPSDSTSAAPLDGWPVEENGHWSPRWRVPLAGADEAQLVREWVALCDSDRDRLLAIVEALPAIVQQSAQQGVVTTDRAKLMEARAQEVRAGVERRVNSLQRRRALLKIMGRATS